MGIPRRRVTRSTGVILEVAVLEYLQELAAKDDRDRSFCINQIVREHAERQGRPLEIVTVRARPPQTKNEEPNP